MRPRAISIVFPVIAALAIVSERSDGQAQDREAEGRAVIAAFAANHASFPYFICRFRETRAQSATLEDALAGNWQNAVSCDYRTAVDGKNELRECFEAAPAPRKLDRDKRATTGKSGFVIGSTSVYSGGGYLTDGDHEMTYWNGLKAINLFRKTEPFQDGIARMPLTASLIQRDLDTPDRLLEKREEWRPTFLGRTVLDGRPVIGVQFDGRNAEHLLGSVQYYFDPAQGYLILRKKRSYSAGSKMPAGAREQVYLMEARECNHQRWFPERTIILLPTTEGGFMVREIKVLELEVNKKPSAADFTLTVPVSTQVSDYHNFSKGTFSLKQDEKINLENLPELFEMLDKVKANPRMDTGISSRDGLGWLRWVGISGGVVLVAGAIYMVVRRRRSKPANNTGEP